MTDSPSSSRVLDITLRRRMPYPIAAAWHRVALAVTPSGQLEQLLNTIPTLLRTLCLFQLPDYLGGPADARVEQTLERLARPSDGHWLQLLRQVTSVLKARAEQGSSSFMPEAYDWLFASRGRPSAGSKALERFIQLRNALRHGDAPIGEQAAKTKLDEIRELCRDIMTDVSWLSGYRPFRVVEQSPTDRPNTFSGRVQFFVSGQALIEPEWAEWNAWLIPNRVYLTGPKGDRFLALHPLLQVLADGSGRRELLFGMREAPKLRRLRLVNAGTGEQIDDAVATKTGNVSFSRWLETRDERQSRVENSHDTESFADDNWARRADAELLNERYQVRGSLGAGGMAIVYRVWDTSFEEEFALKVLSDDLSRDRQFRERFRREGRLMSRVKHPNILTVRDLGEFDDGRLFIKMTVAEGGSLRDFIGSSIPDHTLWAWARSLLSALSHLHEHDIVHRDIKPGNVLLDGRGQVLISDFGIAFDAGDKRLTQSLERLGSMAYMAPEQRTDSTVDGRADVYGLAAILHELMTGKRATHEPGKGLDGALGALVRDMGFADPDARLTARKALERLDAVASDSASVGRVEDQTSSEHEGVGKKAGAERSGDDQPGAAEPSVSPRSLDISLSDERRQAPARVPKLNRLALLALLGLAIAAGITLAVTQSADEAGETDTQLTPSGPLSPEESRALLDNMPIVLIRGATFGLGLSESELTRHLEACTTSGSTRCQRSGYFDRESPEVTLTIDSFYLDRYEVSRLQYQRCVDDGACPVIDERHCQIYDGVNYARADSDGRTLAPQSLREQVPRTCADRRQAATYCSWVESALPTEAQWELAAGGTAERVFAFGDQFRPEAVAHKEDDENFLSLPDERPDGATRAGVLHLSGNAYEWVQDDACRYDDFPTVRNPVCRRDGERGVVRGGSFNSGTASLRTTYRRFMDVDNASDNVGFRCAAEQR